MSQKKKAVLLSTIMTVFILIIEATGPMTVQSQEEQKAHTSVQIMVYGSRKNVEFQVRGEDGKAVKGASIDIRNEKAEWLFYGTTDSSGKKSLWMPLSTQKYRVHKSGYNTAQGNFTIKNLLSKVTVKVTLKKTVTDNTDSKPGGSGSSGDGINSGDSSNGGSEAGKGSGNKGTPPSNTAGTGGNKSGTRGENAADGTLDSRNDVGTVTKSRDKSPLPSDQKKSEGSGDDNYVDKSEENSDYEAENNDTRDADRYGERVDLAVNIYKTDKTPAAGTKVELHSDVLSGTLDDNGFILFSGVEIGDHVLYVKDVFGRTLAQKAFSISRSNMTSLENDGVVTIGVAVAEVTINVEYTEDGQIKLASAWEGLNDSTGKKVSKSDANKASPAEHNLALRIVKDIRTLISLLFLIILFLLGYQIGKKCERKLNECVNINGNER